MILADKIMNERKKNGWSQEELAEKLSVSRQSVSKWEGALATPDLQKVIKMAELFGVSTDYLLKDELEEENLSDVAKEMVVNEPPVRKVSMEEANEFISLKKASSGKIAFGVSFCIFSPVLLMILLGFTQYPGVMLGESIAVAAGVATILVLVATGVFLFITEGNKLHKFEFIEKEAIDTAYGVDGMARKGKEEYASIFNRNIAAGVVLCILAAVPLIVGSVMSEGFSENLQDCVSVWMVAVLLTLVATGVNLIVRAGIIHGAYLQLLQEGEYTVEEKMFNKKNAPIASVYWCSMVAIYLLISFVFNLWSISWIIWPVAGISYGALMAILKAFRKK